MVVLNDRELEHSIDFCGCVSLYPRIFTCACTDEIIGIENNIIGAMKAVKMCAHLPGEHTSVPTKQVTYHKKPELNEDLVF